MKFAALFLATISILAEGYCASASSKACYTDKYDVVWSSPSKSSIESMPVGGGDIGLNVWVEDGDLLFYIGQSGTFDENNHMLKHGRVRLSLTPNPFDEYSEFSQRLNLKSGDLSIHSVTPGNDVEILIWVDVFRPVIHIAVEGAKAMDVTAQFETWRLEDRVLSPVELFSCYTYQGYIDGEITQSKDVVTVGDGAIEWSHRTRDDRLARDFCIKQQGLEEVADRIYDPQSGRTFGGRMWGEGFVDGGQSAGSYLLTPYKGYKIRSARATKRADIAIALAVGQFESTEAWRSKLQGVVAESKKSRNAKAKSEEWWRAFWDRSYIEIGENQSDKKAWEVGRNYQLFRYMLGCNAYGEYPSKFNGSIFTVDPELVNKKYKGVNPDFRQWGGGSFTAQNQRLVYWPMLKSGDFDMMQPQFDFYNNALSSAEARTEYYWGHKGASFTEQLESFGLPIGATWGFESGVRQRDRSTEVGEMTNRWVCNHYVNQLEFSLMILDYHRFSGASIDRYLPFIKSSIQFFDEHYRYEYKRLSGKELDPNGKLVFFPSTAAEMYKVAKNPTDIIAAMQVVINRMLELPASYVVDNEREYYKKLLSILPEIPFDEKEGKKVIKPAESWLYVANNEIPELYTLFPYGVYGIGRDGLDVAYNTWMHGESHEKKWFLASWSQVGIFAARLGLRDEASALIMRRMKDANRRFPAFWGPGVDWLPDFNHGGSCMIQLQEMLMQTIDDKKIYLFPAWKKGWDVRFKLYAPFGTLVEAELRDGELVNLKVTPESRRDDVVIMLE
ncbi:MAG: DUF5703 domain-containing protein [Rikenellaceae bacterium]